MTETHGCLQIKGNLGEMLLTMNRDGDRVIKKEKVCGKSRTTNFN